MSLDGWGGEVLAQHRLNLDAIEAASKKAAESNCGVQVIRHKNGTVSAWADPFTPAMKMYVRDEE